MLEWLVVAFPVAATAVVFTLALATDPHDFVVQRITAPTVFEERGYPAETLADQLEIKITGIVNDAASMHHRRGVEISTTDTAIDEFVDIVKVGQPIRATQRLLGMVDYIADVSFIEETDKRLSVHFRIRDADTLQTLRLHKVDAAEGQVDLLLNHVATEVVSFIDPYIMAAHLYNTATIDAAGTPDFAETIAYIDAWLPKIRDADRPWFYNLLGIIAERSGERQTAIDYYQEALRWRPGFALAEVNWGEALYASGRQDQAIEHYRAALASEPGLAIAHVDLAAALLAGEDFEGAVAQLARARALAPEMARTYEIQADLYEDVGLPELATDERQRAQLARIRQPRQRLYDAM